jgi:hypothetical protein
LEWVQLYGYAPVTLSWQTEAQKSARRRAARTLEAQGKVKLALGWDRSSRRRQLFAYAPDDPKAPVSAYVEGKDGKIYPVTASKTHTRADAARESEAGDS